MGAVGGENDRVANAAAIDLAGDAPEILPRLDHHHAGFEAPGGEFFAQERERKRPRHRVVGATRDECEVMMAG
jgi:hypothetical protein